MTEHAALYAPLRIEPGRSPRLMIFLFSVHTLAAVAVTAVPLPIWMQLGTGLLVALSLVLGFRLHIARNTAQAISSALWDEKGIWKLTLASGENLDARLLPDSVVTQPLIVLNFKTGSRWRSRSLVLPSDAVDSDLLRKLRVRLKLEYGRETNGGLHQL